MDRTVKSSQGYELLDSGGGRKLERFGGRLLDRPCPQAIWNRSEGAPWEEVDAIFSRGEGGSGDWEFKRGMPESWDLKWHDLSFEIRPTGFGNVGLFPEHATHWDWMSGLIAGRSIEAKILNLFAYTGGASLACARAGAKVTHVDSAKAVNGWAMRNGNANGIPDGAVRYLAEDALKFVRREQRRGSRYQGVILDPPTFGRGAKGEVWKIEQDFLPLIELCDELLAEDPLFLLLTSHSPGVTPKVLCNLVDGSGPDIEAGEMLLEGGGRPVPAGCYARCTF